MGHICTISSLVALFIAVSTVDAAAKLCSREFASLQQCLTSTSKGADCPHGWTFYPKTNACYYMLPDSSYKFLEAERACNEFGGHLASVHSHWENVFASMLMKTDEAEVNNWQDLAWIGLQINNEHPSWTDGTPLDYTEWLEGEPNAGPGLYGVLLYANKIHEDADDTLHLWDDIKGSAKLRSGLCKKKV